MNLWPVAWIALIVAVGAYSIIDKVGDGRASVACIQSGKEWRVPPGQGWTGTTTLQCVSPTSEPRP